MDAPTPYTEWLGQLKEQVKRTQTTFGAIALFSGVLGILLVSYIARDHALDREIAATIKSKTQIDSLLRAIYPSSFKDTSYSNAYLKTWTVALAFVARKTGIAEENEDTASEKVAKKPAGPPKVDDAVQVRRLLNQVTFYESLIHKMEARVQPRKAGSAKSYDDLTVEDRSNLFKVLLFARFSQTSPFKEQTQSFRRLVRVHQAALIDELGKTVTKQANGSHANKAFIRKFSKNDAGPMVTGAQTYKMLLVPFNDIFEAEFESRGTKADENTLLKSYVNALKLSLDQQPDKEFREVFAGVGFERIKDDGEPESTFADITDSTLYQTLDTSLRELQARRDQVASSSIEVPVVKLSVGVKEAATVATVVNFFILLNLAIMWRRIRITATHCLDSNDANVNKEVIPVILSDCPLVSRKRLEWLHGLFLASPAIAGWLILGYLFCKHSEFGSDRSWTAFLDSHARISLFTVVCLASGIYLVWHCSGVAKCKLKVDGKYL